MKRLIGTFAGLMLVLTACPGNPQPPVPVSITDANVPSGVWAATLVQRRDPRIVAEAGGQIFLLDGYVLESVDVQSGRQLHVVAIPVAPVSNAAYAYRSDGTILPVGEPDLLTYDASTLTLQSSRLLPRPRDGSAQLSADGRILTYNAWDDATRVQYATETGTRLPVPVGENLIGTAEDGRWWLLARSDAQGVSYRMTNPSTGAGFTVPGRSDAACPNARSAAVMTQRRAGSATAADPVRLLVFHPDGRVDVRDSAGTILSTVPFTAPCTVMDAGPLPQAGLVRVKMLPSSGVVTSALIDAESGRVLHSYTSSRTATAAEGGEVGADGVMVTSTPTLPFETDRTDDAYWLPENLPKVSYRPWSGTGWTLPNAAVPVTLNLTVVRTDAQNATVTGEGTAGGEARTVTGRLTAFQSTLSAQMTAYSPTLNVTLNMFAGAAADGRLDMFNRLPYVPGTPPAVDTTRRPGYVVGWQRTGHPHLQGVLHRP